VGITLTDRRLWNFKGDGEIGMAIRFKNAKANDLVYSELYRNGVITKVDLFNEKYPIIVLFDNKNRIGFRFDGKRTEDDAEPTLFYRSDTDNYLTIRPTNWETVLTGTMCDVWDDPECLIIEPFRFYANGRPWFGSKPDNVVSYKLAEIRI